MFDTNLIFKTKGLNKPSSSFKKAFNSNVHKTGKLLVKQPLFDALNLSIIDEGETETEELTRQEIDLKEFQTLPDEQKQKYIVNRITKNTFEAWE